ASARPCPGRRGGFGRRYAQDRREVAWPLRETISQPRGGARLASIARRVRILSRLRAVVSAASEPAERNAPALRRAQNALLRPRQRNSEVPQLHEDSNCGPVSVSCNQSIGGYQL